MKNMNLLWIGFLLAFVLKSNRAFSHSHRSRKGSSYHESEYSDNEYSDLGDKYDDYMYDDEDYNESVGQPEYYEQAFSDDEDIGIMSGDGSEFERENPVATVVPTRRVPVQKKKTPKPKTPAKKKPTVSKTPQTPQFEVVDDLPVDEDPTLLEKIMGMSNTYKLAGGVGIGVLIVLVVAVIVFSRKSSGADGKKGTLAES